MQRQGALPGPSVAPSSPVLGPASSIAAPRPRLQGSERLARGETISLASGAAGKRQRQGTTQTPSKTPAKRDGKCPALAAVPTQKYIIMLGCCGAPRDQREGRGLLRAPLLGGLSPSSSSLQGRHRGPAPPRALCARPLPGTAWSLATGCRGLQSRPPASDMPLRGCLEPGATGRVPRWAAATGTPARGARRGLSSSSRKKTGEGGIKNKSSLASLSARGRVSVRGGGCSGGLGRGPGGSGSACAGRSGVGSRADTRRRYGPASAVFRLPCQ